MLDTRFVKRVLLPFQTVLAAVETRLRRNIAVVIITDPGAYIFSRLYPFRILLAGQNVKVRTGIKNQYHVLTQISASQPSIPRTADIDEKLSAAEAK